MGLERQPNVCLSELLSCPLSMSKIFVVKNSLCNETQGDNSALLGIWILPPPARNGPLDLVLSTC